MTNQIIIQGIGIIALIFFILSFQAKSRKNILLFHLVSMIFFAIHFSLLAAWTAVAMVSLNAVKSYIFTLKDRYKFINSEFTLYLFIFLFWIFGILTWEGYHSLFVIIALNFVVLSHWSDNTTRLRWLFLISHPLWISYDLFVGSYAGIISETVVLISGCIGLWRFRKNKTLKN